MTNINVRVFINTISDGHDGPSIGFRMDTTVQEMWRTPNATRDSCTSPRPSVSRQAIPSHGMTVVRIVTQTHVTNLDRVLLTHRLAKRFERPS